MKLKSLALLIISLGVATGALAETKKKVYKCKGDVEGRYIYQSKPCPNSDDEPEKNELKIVPTDEERVKAAREKLEKDLEAHKAKKEEATGVKKEAQVLQVNLPPKAVNPPPAQTPPPKKPEK